MSSLAPRRSPETDDCNHVVLRRARSRDLLPALRERAQETEDAPGIPAENVKALQDTGFFRLLQPRRYDGLEAAPVDFYRASG